MHLTRDPIDVGRLIGAVQAPTRGGVALFVGTVRRGPDDGPVAAIEYSAHEAMVEAEFEKILREAEARWADTGVAALHRIGRLAVGEASIAIVAAAPHRADAFAACRHVIEEAKRRLPVWKKELFDDGTVTWRENETPDGGSPPAPVATPTT